MPELEQIEAVRRAVEEIRQAFEKTAEEADKLEVHALRDNPAGRDIVKRVHRKCLWHTEELLRKMIELDAIASQGDEEIKRARRVTVLEIQAIMDQVDAVSRRLQQLHDELPEPLTVDSYAAATPSPVPPACAEGKEHTNGEGEGEKEKMDVELQKPQPMEEKQVPQQKSKEQTEEEEEQMVEEEEEEEGEEQKQKQEAGLQEDEPSEDDSEEDQPPPKTPPPRAMHGRPVQPHPSRMPPTSYPPYVSRDPYNRYAYANQYHEAPIRTSRPGGQTWVPKVDVREERDRYIIEANLPGLSRDDIEVSVTRDVLTIQGNFPEPLPGKYDYWKRERAIGPFRRSFTLPPDADASRITADYRNGVLGVLIPKKRPARLPYFVNIS